VIERPATRASPPVGAIRQLNIAIVVDFPAPFGPSSEKISPSRMSNDTLSTASTPLGGLYCLRRSRTSMIGGRADGACAAPAWPSLARRRPTTSASITRLSVIRWRLYRSRAGGAAAGRCLGSTISRPDRFVMCQ
jgi:hypothetical protein